MNDATRAAMEGLLIGDALGVPYEFHAPHLLPPLHRIDMLPPEDFRRAHDQLEIGLLLSAPTIGAKFKF